MYTKSTNGKHEQLRNFLLFTAAVANQQRNREKEHMTARLCVRE